MKRFLFLCTVVAAVSIVLSGCANRDMQKVRQTMTDRCLNVLLSPAYEAYKLSQIQKNEPIDSVAYVQRLTAVLDSTVQASMANRLTVRGRMLNTNATCAAVGVRLLIRPGC